MAMTEWATLLPVGPCEGCAGSPVPGARVDADNGVDAPPPGFVLVERCDTCARFADDRQAAAAWGTDARWLVKTDDHAAAGCRPPAGWVPDRPATRDWVVWLESGVRVTLPATVDPDTPDGLVELKAAAVWTLLRTKIDAYAITRERADNVA